MTNIPPVPQERKTSPYASQSFGLTRRKYRRLDLHLPIEYGPKSSIARTGNISMGGLLIYLPEETAVSQHLRLRLFISLGSKLHTINMVAKVMWVNRTPNGRGCLPHGLKFIQMSRENKSSLKGVLRVLSPSLTDGPQGLLSRHKRFLMASAVRIWSFWLNKVFSSLNALLKPTRKNRS